MLFVINRNRTRTHVETSGGGGGDEWNTKQRTNKHVQRIEEEKGAGPTVESSHMACMSCIGGGYVGPNTWVGMGFYRGGCWGG